MKRYLVLLTFIFSTSSMAFPTYNVVNCHGNVNGHITRMQYNKSNRILVLNVDGSEVAGYANEVDNRIYTDTEYDEYGNAVYLEILSNNLDWQARLNVYLNNSRAVTGILNCKKLGITDASVQAISSKGLIPSLKLLNTQ